MTKVFPSDFPPDASLRMHADGVGNYWFYHKGTFPSDEPLLYKRLISSAISSVEVWDPYFNIDIPKNNDQDVFDLINSNVTIKILTKKGLARNTTYLTDVHNAMRTKIPQSKNIRFGLRVINKGDTANQGNWFFHDRFLIIDGTEVYFIGGSVGWHTSSIESTGILKIDHSDTKIFIKSLFDEYWRQANNHEISIQYLHLHP